MLPFGPEYGDTTLNLQLDVVSDVYVSGTIHIPYIQVDAEIYDRLYVSEIPVDLCLNNNVHVHLKLASKVLHEIST